MKKLTDIVLFTAFLIGLALGVVFGELRMYFYMANKYRIEEIKRILKKEVDDDSS